MCPTLTLKPRLSLFPSLVRRRHILGDPGAVSGGGKKAKRARKKIGRRKVKKESRSPWDSSLNGPVPKPFKILASDWAQKYFLCPITGKDFKWFRNWSIKRRIPGAPTFFLDFSSPNFFPRPFSLFPAPTNCPWVSEDVVDRETLVEPDHLITQNLGDERNGWQRGVAKSRNCTVAHKGHAAN